MTIYFGPHPHFTSRETEAQRGADTRPMSVAGSWQNWDTHPHFLVPQPVLALVPHWYRKELALMKSQQPPELP